MKPVNAQFIIHPQIDQQHASNARGQPNQIDKERTLETFEISVDEKKIVTEHSVFI
jgi:hypothetical protein